MKNKNQDCTSKTKVDSLHKQVPKIFLNLTSTPKIALTDKQKNCPQRPKKGKKAQNLAELKTERYAGTFKTRINSLHQQVPKMFLNLTWTPKIITQKGPRKCKRGPNMDILRTNKTQGCSYKTKVDCLYRNGTKKFVNLTPTIKNNPEGS